MSDETQPTGIPNPGEGSANTDTTSTTTQQGTGADGQPGSEGTGEGGTAKDTAADNPEGKGADGAPSKDETAAGAPEQYGAFDLPEGFALEGERLGIATEFFKANNWTQEQAQQAVTLYTQMAAQDAVVVQQAMEAQRLQQIEQWGQDAKAQLGDKYDIAVSRATTAVKSVNDPELTQAFNDLGLGNHPALIRAFAHFGEFLGESPMDAGGSGNGGSAPKSLAERMYPGMKT